MDGQGIGGGEGDGSGGARQADALAFSTAVRALTTPADCADLFRAAIRPFGFDTFACGEIDLADRDRNAFYIIDWPDAWRRFYMEEGLLERDPIVSALASHREAFTWSDLRREGSLLQLGIEALDRAAAYGWVEGLVVPLPRTGSRVGLVSMAGRIGDHSPQDIAYLTLISVCLHAHVRTLLPREGFAAPPAGLTTREIECARLVARGCSDRVIADQLGIAASTVHEYVEKARGKLKTRSRAEMVAVAASLGIIEL